MSLIGIVGRKGQGSVRPRSLTPPYPTGDEVSGEPRETTSDPVPNL